MPAIGWRSLNEVLGHLAAGIVRGAPRRSVAGATLVEDERFDRLFRLVPKRPSAMTFGSTIVARRRLEPPLVAHELAHVAQYTRFGPFYLPLYLLGAAWGLLRHRDFYRGNPFEAAAIEAQRKSEERA